MRALRRSTSSEAALSSLAPEVVVGDILNPASLRSAMDGCELVFHAAAISQYWRNGVDLLYRVNVAGTRNVLRTALKLGVDRVVLTSSVATLGVPTADNALLTESTDYNMVPDRFHYGHSKLLAEAELHRIAASGLDVICVNPSTVIGARDVNFIGGEILRRARKGWLWLAPPGGMGVVSAKHVGLGHVLAAELGRSDERYILNGENILHRDLLAIVAAEVGGRPPLFTFPKSALTGTAAAARAISKLRGVSLPTVFTQADLSARKMYFDGHKARRELGVPQSTARVAVREAWLWYRQEGML